MGLGPGGRYTVEQLLQGLLMASGNDAAHALAQQLGGDEETFNQDQQARNRFWAHALPSLLATLASMHPVCLPRQPIWRCFIPAAFENPTFARIVGTDSVKFPGYGDLEGYELGNDNGLFMNDPDGIGGKTGYTDDANHTFVGALDRDGRRLMAVILDTTMRPRSPRVGASTNASR